MKRKKNIHDRIARGEVNRQDVLRRLGELAYGNVNDCVRLVMEGQKDLDGLDLSLLTEIKRSEKGAVEVKLVDRLQVLKLLAELAGEETMDIEGVLRVIQGGEP